MMKLSDFFGPGDLLGTVLLSRELVRSLIIWSTTQKKPGFPNGVRAVHVKQGIASKKESKKYCMHRSVDFFWIGDEDSVVMLVRRFRG